LIETKSGGKTSSRTSQALTTVTAKGLTGHVTVKRLIEKSARRRIARFTRQGRHAKLTEKVKGVAEVVPISPVISNSVAVGKDEGVMQAETERGPVSVETTVVPQGKNPKQARGNAKAGKKKNRNLMRQDKIKKMIALSAKRLNKK
jgi:hypothetical protein